MRQTVRQQYDALDKQGMATAESLTYRLKNPSPSGGWTIGSFASKMISDASAQSVGYQRNLKSRLSVFVAFAGNELPLANINLKLLDRFKRHLQAAGKMSGTQHTYFNRIKRMTGEALKLELIEKDPFLHFDIPADKPAPRLKLTDAQLEAQERVEVGAKRIDAKGRRYEAGTGCFGRNGSTCLPTRWAAFGAGMCCNSGIVMWLGSPGRSGYRQFFRAN